MEGRNSLEPTRSPEIVEQVRDLRSFVEDCLKLTHGLEERLNSVLEPDYPEAAVSESAAVKQGTKTLLGGELYDIRKSAELSADRLRRILQRIAV